MIEPAAQELPEESDLLAWLADAGQLIPNGEMSVQIENANLFAAIFGLCAQTLRFGEAYRMLYIEGHAREGVPVARAALEHAVTAQWVYHEEGGLSRLQATARRSSRDYFSTIANYVGNTDLAATAEAELDEDRKGLPKFGEIMRLVGDFVSANYKQMSQVTHVTGSTVAAFATVVDGRIEFQGAPDDPHGHVNLYTACCAVMLAAWLMGQMITTPDIRERLDTTAARLRLPQTIRADGS